MADRFLEPEDPGVVHLYDVHNYPYSNYNTGTVRPTYRDRLASTFNFEWGPDPWHHRSLLGPDMPHVTQGYSSTGFLGPLSQAAGSSVAQGTTPMYVTPATSSTRGSYFQLGIPATSSIGGSYFQPTVPATTSTGGLHFQSSVSVTTSIGGSHFQSGVPASCNTGVPYFHVSGSAPVPSYATLPLSESFQHQVHICDCG